METVVGKVCQRLRSCTTGRRAETAIGDEQKSWFAEDDMRGGFTQTAKCPSVIRSKSSEFNP
jgi:hypothetical protein